MRKKGMSFILAMVMICTSLPAFSLEAEDWRVTDLKCNAQVQPLAVDDAAPEFTWRMEAAWRGARQSAWRLQVFEAEGTENQMWDSGKTSGDTTRVTYEGAALNSAARYRWEVEVWNEKGDSRKAEAYFETAFMDSAEFDAALISAARRLSYQGDYTVEYDTRVVRDSAGLIFAGSSAADNIAVQMKIKTGAVTLGVIKTASGRGSAVGSWEVPGAAVTDTFHIRIAVVGNTAAIYVNDAQIGSCTDPLVSFGVLGFRHYNSTNDQETAYYDNLIVRDAQLNTLLSFDFTSVNPFNTGEITQGMLLVNPISGNYSVSTYEELMQSGGQPYTMEMDFKIDSTAFGFCFGGSDAKNHLMWQINIKKGETGQVVYLRPHAFTNGSGVSLAEIDLSAVIPWEARNDWHHMKITVDAGNQLQTWINGVLVDTRKNSLAAMSQIGFRQTKGDNEIAWVDNFSLKNAAEEPLIAADFEDHLDPFSTGRTQQGALYLDKCGLFMRDVEQEGAPMFRRDFALEEGKTVEKARLYATALGTYEAYLNGRRVGTDCLAPGWTEYFDRLDYQAYDVTELLLEGDNAIGAVVGNGWYAGHIGEGNCNYQYYGIDVAFKGALIITYTDGTQQILKTDESWTCSTDSPYLVTDHSNGETYDAAREQPGWNLPGFEAQGWHGAVIATNETIRTNVDLSKVTLRAQPDEPVRVFKTITPVSVNQVGEDTFIYDMGQNFAGVVSLTASGQKGQTVRLRYGEMLYDENDGALEGSLYTANLRTAHATDYYTFGEDGTVTYTPAFTYHGFRYVEVSGLSAPPALAEVQGVVWSSVGEITSSLETSSALINQIYSNTIWSQLSNYVSVPTDCPQRDERLGWSGDAQVFASTAAFNADVEAFLTQYLSIYFGKQGENGGLPHFAPTYSPSKSSGGTAGWCDAAVVIPYVLYKSYGDVGIIETYYGNMQAWIRQRLAEAGYEQNGSLIIRTGSYGDWLSSGENTPVPITSTAYFGYAVKLLGKMAAIIGKAEDAAWYNQLFSEISTQFKHEFVLENGRIIGDSQTAYALSLGTGILQDPALEQLAVARLAKKVRENGMKLTTGFLGTNFLCPVLSRYGYSDIAYALVLQTEYPSWGYSVVNGATTIWERWNSYTAGGGLGANSSLGSTMNSYNHYCYGSIVSWMFEQMAGIQPDEDDPGFHHILMQPAISDQLNFVNASYESVYGTISSSWEVADGRYLWRVTIPANASATIWAPGDGRLDDMDQVRALGKEGTANIYELSSGSYEITGALNADPSVLRDRLAEIDLDFYTQNYADQGLSTVYQSAADYLAGGVYTEERLDTLLENLESCLSALACVSRPQEEGMVCIGDYTRFPNEAAYQITTASEWIYFAQLVESGVTFQGKTVYLKNDLDFSGMEMQSVGKYTEDYGKAFQGTLEGGYHMLRNVYIFSQERGAGAFGATYGATIRRLGVSGIVAANSVSGGIVGYGDGGTLIEECWNEATVVANQSSDGAAGIAGNLRHGGTIRRCYNLGTIMAPTSAAGICSWGQNGGSAANIADCYSLGELIVINADGASNAIVRYNGTVNGKTANCHYWSAYAGTAAAQSGTIAQSPEAFRDGSVASALAMRQGAQYPVLTVRNDVNGSGTFDSADPVALMRRLNGWQSEVCLHECDANGDQRLSIADVVLMLQELAA